MRDAEVEHLAARLEQAAPMVHPIKVHGQLGAWISEVVAEAAAHLRRLASEGETLRRENEEYKRRSELNPLTGYSSTGVNIWGDEPSMKIVRDAFHSHGSIEEIRRNLLHWREECGKLHAKVRASESDNSRLRGKVEEAVKLLAQAMDSRAADYADASYPGWHGRADAFLGSLNPEKETTDVILKPCPFCGGEAERIDIEDAGDNFGGSAIQCKQCGAGSPIHFDRKENLYSSWNDRARCDDQRADHTAGGG